MLVCTYEGGKHSLTYIYFYIYVCSSKCSDYFFFLCMYTRLLFLCPIYGHYVFWSVRPFVRPSVPLQVKVFGHGSF